MQPRLFVYGTLQAAECLQGLLNRVPPTRPALLRGYARWRIHGASFPAIIRSAETDSVTGVLLEELTPRELRALDFYEDEFYERLAVRVEPISAGGVQLDAMAYVWPSSHSHLVDIGAPWSYEAWRENVMTEFVSEVVEPCQAEFNEYDADRSSS